MIVITTPTGNIGGRLLEILVDRAPAHDERLRVIVRDPAKLTESIREQVEVVSGSHCDAATVAKAFDGADAVFWLVPPDPATPSLRQAYSGFTRAAAGALTEHGVGHVVGVSALGRGTPVADRAGLVTASLEMDDVIAGTGVHYRALANASFMDNMLRQVDSIRAAGVFTGTLAAELRAPQVCTGDIAAAAAAALLDRSWTGSGELPVLGPADLTANEMAHIMSEVLGRPVRYHRESLDELATATARYAGDAFVRGMVDMMRAKDEGLDNGAPRTPQTTTPTTFRQWCATVLAPAVAA
ncbi:MAG: NAD(P)H-binding protein [Nocardia sp.]|nr:NAD(P)H-binding protein [Nocardia sp.]